MRPARPIVERPAKNSPMKSNNCPHCGSASAVPAWRKMLLSPVSSTYCRSCREKVSVSYVPYMVVAVAGIGAGSAIVAKFPDAVWPTRLVWAVALVVIMLFIQCRFVRLVAQ
jgi:hypothetical protein